ncbi:MAG: AAA family ATPase [Planctomycetota bacterium]
MVDSLVESQFIDAIDASRRVYVDVLIDPFLADPQRCPLSQDEFLEQLESRFELILGKVFVEVVESDLYLSPAEAELARTLLRHTLKKSVWPSKIVSELSELSEKAKAHSWSHVLEPLNWYPEACEHRLELKTCLLRVANIVAKVDGRMAAEAISQLRMLDMQLEQHLPEASPPCPDETAENQDSLNELESGQLSKDLIEMIEQETKTSKPKANASKDAKEEPATLSDEECEQQLQQALAELDDLVGIERVREEVKTLVNVCKLQRAREAHGMPVKPLSLHMVFTGNPGTGKTTVARIIGKIFGGLGVLTRGHLVETDRSGLVADYQGQTATKTNELVDQALDGVLFIDEAYALAPEGQADSYGQEAVGTLLKRMEDDRHRLVVILAGYDQPMELMLKSNPGLSSRFSRQCHFEDYNSEELCQIYERLAIANCYTVSQPFREALLHLLGERVAGKDEHFGNGRMVRNIFENAIRRLANRVVESNDLTPDVISTFQVSDLGQQLVTSNDSQCIS